VEVPAAEEISPAAADGYPRYRPLKNGRSLHLAPYQDRDGQDLFRLFDATVARREGFPHEPPLTWETFRGVWAGASVATVLGRFDDSQGALVGAYYLKPNFAGRAAHIANAGYVAHREARNLGVGRNLIEDSIRRAPVLGYDAIQFNLVFAANPARRLYEELGWQIIGRIPRAVDGQDALIYWRSVP
jgi:GNAT superfamily N-acetyltransferase